MARLWGWRVPKRGLGLLMTDKGLALAQSQATVRSGDQHCAWHWHRWTATNTPGLSDAWPDPGQLRKPPQWPCPRPNYSASACRSSLDKADVKCMRPSQRNWAACCPTPCRSRCGTLNCVKSQHLPTPLPVPNRHGCKRPCKPSPPPPQRSWSSPVLGSVRVSIFVAQRVCSWCASSPPGKPVRVGRCLRNTMQTRPARPWRKPSRHKNKPCWVVWPWAW